MVACTKLNLNSDANCETRLGIGAHALGAGGGFFPVPLFDLGGKIHSYLKVTLRDTNLCDYIIMTFRCISNKLICVLIFSFKRKILKSPDHRKLFYEYDPLFWVSIASGSTVAYLFLNFKRKKVLNFTATENINILVGNSF